jgi:hypothetical protein
MSESRNPAKYLTHGNINITEDQDGFLIELLPIDEKCKGDNENYEEENHIDLTHDSENIIASIIELDCKNANEYLDFKKVPLTNICINGIYIHDIYQQYKTYIKTLISHYEDLDQGYIQYYSLYPSNKIMITPFRKEMDHFTFKKYYNFSLFFNLETEQIEGPFSLYGLPYSRGIEPYNKEDLIMTYGSLRALEDAEKYLERTNSKKHISLVGNELVTYFH